MIVGTSWKNMVDAVLSIRQLSLSFFRCESSKNETRVSESGMTNGYKDRKWKKSSREDRVRKTCRVISQDFAVVNVPCGGKEREEVS